MALDMRNAVMAAAVVVLAGAAWPVSAHAGDVQMKNGTAQDKEITDPTARALRSAENPHIKIVENKARALVAPLSQPQLKDLYMMREGYGILQSVKIVMRDVGNAVRLCGEDNPDMKAAMAERHKSWEEAIGPVVKDDMKKLQISIDRQEFTDPKKIRDYFKALDDATAYAEKKFDKRVVTTKEACQTLQDSMDDSQQQIADLLGTMKFVELPKAADKAENKAEDKPAPVTTEAPAGN